MFLHAACKVSLTVIHAPQSSTQSPSEEADLTPTGIDVSSTPVAVNNATADVTIFLLLGALRRVHNPYTAVRASQWRGPAFQLGHDPKNKLLGILGMGGIGREVAARARAFGMKIQYHNRSRLAPELEQGAQYVSFEELVGTSDVLSLNCSLRKETVGIIGRKEFELMKQGVVIVNTARGKLIDEAALVDALDSGKVYSAGLDVYEEEPKVHEGLLKNPNVVLLPHIGTGTVETQASWAFRCIGALTNNLAERYGVTGAGELEECRREGDSDYAGARTATQGKIIANLSYTFVVRGLYPSSEPRWLTSCSQTSNP